MSKNNSVSIRVKDFNEVVKDDKLLKSLRKLTLVFSSGLKKEVDNLVEISKSRPVRAYALLAYKQVKLGTNPKLVGWSLLSKEKSVMCFGRRHNFFHSTDGYLFEVYIKPSYRRQGIATELFRIAKRKAKPYQLCVAPWDVASTKFFNNFKHITLWL